MATGSSPVANGNPTQSPDFRLPPEDRFWQRYSPHHELLFSVVSSVLLHGLGLAILFLGLLAVIGITRSSPPIKTDVVTVRGSGEDGQPAAGVGGPGKGGIPQSKEVIGGPDPLRGEPSLPIDNPRLKNPHLTQPPLLPPERAESRRSLEAERTVRGGQLRDIGRRTQEILARKGHGDRNSQGPYRSGRPGSMASTLSRKRQARWILLFSTRDGREYLQQLHDLKAFLAVPQPDDRYLVYRDLGQPPPQGKVEDISGLEQIPWYDDKPHSVRSLAQALGLAEVPPFIIAFFPVQLEKELLEKELKYSGGQGEDAIAETVFRVVRRPGGASYELVVESQQLKRR